MLNGIQKHAISNERKIVLSQKQTNSLPDQRYFALRCTDSVALVY